MNTIDADVKEYRDAICSAVIEVLMKHDRPYVVDRVNVQLGLIAALAGVITQPLVTSVGQQAADLAAIGVRQQLEQQVLWIVKDLNKAKKARN